MMDFLRGWIVNIVTISIVLVLFEIIIPSGKIKKIINLTSGFVLLIAVINPFLSLKNQSFDLGDNIVSDSLYIDKKEMETSSRYLQDKQMKQVSQVYRNKLASSIKEQTEKLDGVSESNVTVEINEDYQSDKFGEITRVTVEIKKGKKQAESVKINSVVPVKKINIKLPFISSKDQEKHEVQDSESKRLTELVKQNINKSLEISKDSIVVTVE